MILLLSVLIAAYVLMSALAYAMYFAYLQREYPSMAEKDYNSNRSFSLKCAIFGPASLIAAVIVTSAKHGLKWR